MSVTTQIDKSMNSSQADRKLHTLLAIPANFYAIPFGLVGLARVWRLASDLFGLPASIGTAFFLVATAVFLILLLSFATKLVLAPRTVTSELKHPVLGPFYSLLPISGMLLAVGLQPYALGAALVVFWICFIATALLGGWLTGQWIVSELDIDKFHPGYFLPTVAGGLLGGESAAHFGLIGLGWMSFGVGMICWIVLGSIILNRLFFRSALPGGLIPTLAIEIAPPVVAGNTYFFLTGGRVDLFAYFLAGYAVLMALVQLRLAPVYLKLAFTPGFWGFTFSYAAAAGFAMRWIGIEHPPTAALLGLAVLAAITLLIGGIAVRTLVSLGRGKLIPISQTSG
jgi:tellurite resistance protein